MIQQLDDFLAWWWRGLKSPWPSKRITNIAKYDVSQQTVVNVSDPKKPHYIQVSSDSVLSAPIPSPLKADQLNPPNSASSSLDDIIQSAFPFMPHEVYATISDNHILAVLKQDVNMALSKAKDEKLLVRGLALPYGDGNAFVALPDFVDEKHPHRIFFSSLFLLLCLTVTVLYNQVRNEQTRLQRNSDRLDAISSQASVAPYPSQLTSPDGVLAQQVSLALKETSNSLNEDTSLDQISIEYSASHLVLILDANSSSAAAQLTSLEQNDNFTRTNFVGSISSTPGKNIERYRLKTFYTLKKQGIDSNAEAVR